MPTRRTASVHHVTGEDCLVVKIVARSMSHLEEVADALARSGSLATSVVYSTPLLHRVITSDAATELDEPDA